MNIKFTPIRSNFASWMSDYIPKSTLPQRFLTFENYDYFQSNERFYEIVTTHQVVNLIVQFSTSDIVVVRVSKIFHNYDVCSFRSKSQTKRIYTDPPFHGVPCQYENTSSINWVTLLYYDQNSFKEGETMIVFSADSLSTEDSEETFLKQNYVGYSEVDSNFYGYIMIDITDSNIMCYKLNSRLNLTYSPTAPRLKRNDEIKLIFENYNFRKEIMIPIFNQDGSMVNWTRLIIVCSLFVFIFIFLVFLDRWIKKKRTFEDKLLIIDDVPVKKVLID
eukprot:TRINITY_DN4628_c0_g1_i5.p1 TRINITY_DN4628_c0_g1~~TRINITY_DN4628_c0_g1_i5.p1  ORF type:complete len:276 (+),score=36.02 TRINITY_DN4628_c0_g1_i5:110-937(+)